MATHQETLDRKREEERKKEKTGSTNSNREVLINGATLICPYSLSLGILKVTSNEILTQNKLCATEGDANGSINLQFEGLCMHPKWGSKKPMCKDVIKLEKWQGVGNAIYQEQRVLIKGSSIACNPTQNVPSQKPIPKVENFALSDSSNQENTSSKPGYYYQENGTFLGKINNSESVFITDKATFEKIKNKETVKASLVIAFTEKYKLNNTQLLDRANWIFAEGRGAVALYYAFSIENSYLRPSIANKKESQVYYWLMQDDQGRLDKNKYLSGTSHSQNKDNPKEFWDLRQTPDKFDSAKRNCVSAVIKSKLYTKKDITGGCTGWLGYGGPKHTGEFRVKVLERWHFFRIVGKEYKSFAIEKTLEQYENEIKTNGLD